MATRKEPRAGRRSEPDLTDKEVEIEAIEEWLRIVDKPLGREKKDANGMKSSN